MQLIIISFIFSGGDYYDTPAGGVQEDRSVI